jgi:hypothetical protein
LIEPEYSIFQFFNDPLSINVGRQYNASFFLRSLDEVFLEFNIIDNLNDLNRVRMERGNREIIGDRRRMREAVRRRYLTVFNIQLILEIGSEAVLYE